MIRKPDSMMGDKESKSKAIDSLLLQMSFACLRMANAVCNPDESGNILPDVEEIHCWQLAAVEYAAEFDRRNQRLQ